MRITVRASATVANLGPGFDCLALALELWNLFVLDTDAEPGVEVRGEGADELADPASNRVVRAMEAAAEAAGRPLPPHRLWCRNGIPLRGGLGSSATAVVGGLLLADRLLAGAPDGPAEARLLEAAVDLEGHADNVAACLLGGLTISYQTDEGWRAERLEPHPDLRLVVLVPERDRLATGEARRALPAAVPLADAVFNLGRTALVVEALTHRPELLTDALEDRLHQPYRLALVPGAATAFHTLRMQGIPACVAGSGPSLLAFPPDGRSIPDIGPGWRVVRVGASSSGADVVVE